jgi:two-component sensor histidine kinase
MQELFPSLVGEMRFLAGFGEMAERIRRFDWSGHPFGAPRAWPQSLRSALSICLNAAFPTAIYWGPDLRLIYNDAWSPIPGPRHPAALGAPAREVWADIWPVIEPQFSEVLREGKGLFLENQMLPKRRFGAPEETYWSYSFTPIRGEDGSIVGVFNSGSETTRSVLRERQMRFLLELGEVLRASGTPEEGRAAAVARLGEHLGVDRVGFGEIEGDAVKIVEEWTVEGVAPVGRSVSLSAFGAHVVGELRAGRVLRIDDVAADDRYGAAGVRRAFASLGVAAVVAVPCFERAKLAGVMFLHTRAPRAWNDFDVSTVEEVLERTRSWIERERAAERERIMMREIDHRARNVLAVAQSVVRLTRAEDIASYREKVEERIAALARAHTLLANERWSGVDLRTLIGEELAPFEDEDGVRVALDGPSVLLPAAMAQTMALALHELATNAAKHGALRGPDGDLRVSWRIEPGQRLRLDWAETLPGDADRPEVAMREGFGSVLIARVIEGQFGGAIERTFGSSGFRCRIRFPLEGRHGGTAPAEAARGRRVLIAEDEPIIALELEAMVQGLGYGVFGVYGTLEAALAATEADRPEVAVVDADLRGETSLPLVERLRGAGVPVILATGYDTLAGGAGGFGGVPKLTKPVSERALAAALAGAMPPA